MISRRKFRTKEARIRERKRKCIRFGLYVICFLFLVGCVTYASNNENFRIQEIYIITNGVIEKTEFTSLVEAELKGSIFGVWPKDSAFIIRHENIKNAIEQQFPRVESVNMKRTGFFGLSITIKEKSPVALWCGDLVPLIAYAETRKEERSQDELWGKCYLLDKNGYIYARAPLFSGDVFPRYYGALEQAEPIGQQYIPRENFLVWQDLYVSLHEQEIQPQALLFVDEIDVELYLVNGIKILIPRDEDMEVLKRRLFSLLDSDAIDESKEVEYVDLRFGKKVFIKYFDD